MFIYVYVLQKKLTEKNLHYSLHILPRTSLIKCLFFIKSPSLSDFSQEIFVYMQKKLYLCRRI